MHKFSEIENVQAQKSISDFIADDNSISYIFVGWQDGDYFEELCNENGGVIPEHFEIFKKMNRNYKVNSKDELMEAISKYQETPCLLSRNGSYRFNYDMHIWSENTYSVYNAIVKKIRQHKRNFINKILSPMSKPNWDK